MLKVIKSEKIPIKTWAEEIEESALKQAQNLANLPFAFHHIALMPDVHSGFGMPIGGVLAADNAIIPNAVGVDIGCGMCAAKTSLSEIEPKVLKEIHAEIRKRVPVGFRKHKQKQNRNFLPDDMEIIKGGIVEKHFDNLLYQMGTLGGGNHFIEIQKGDDDHIYIMVHSGSRNTGKQVADHYHKLALNRLQNTSSHTTDDLAFFPADSLEAQQYLSEMNDCIKIAFANRKLMMTRIQAIFSELLGADFYEEEFINIPHNYAVIEEHFGKLVFVHRKGATSARKGETGIIPGSQGTESYIVIGKGNPQSFMSCSHGAGRKMSRRKARKTLDFKNEASAMNRRGIIHALRHKKDLDEAPGAYKDIRKVMENQQDLITVRTKLKPLSVVKA